MLDQTWLPRVSLGLFFLLVILGLLDGCCSSRNHIAVQDKQQGQCSSRYHITGGSWKTEAMGAVQMSPFHLESKSFLRQPPNPNRIPFTFCVTWLPPALRESAKWTWLFSFCSPGSRGVSTRICLGLRAICHRDLQSSVSAPTCPCGQLRSKAMSRSPFMSRA